MRPFRILLLPLLLMVVAGCSTDESARSGAAEGLLIARRNVARSGNDTLVFASPDAPASDRQLPDPVCKALRKPLETWTLSWRLALPTLRLEELEREATLPFADEEATPYDGSLAGAELRLQHLVVPSPAVWLLLDPFLDIELEATDQGAVHAERVDEPGVAIVDLNAHSERRVFELPRGSRVDGAHWLDEARAVVLVDEAAAGGRRPVLYLVHVAEENVVRYVGPVAEAAEARAARTDLDRRFRAARPALQLASR